MKPLHFALIGGEISYSRSPDIFRAVFEQLGCEGRFDLCATQSENLQAEIRRLVKSGVAGVSVTIPHKETIIRHLDSVDDLARTVGAVNSIAIRDGQLCGYNTDCYGAAFALRRAGFKGCERAVIIGSGGAARAVAQVLVVDFGVLDFVFCGRNAAKLADLKYHIGYYGQDIVIGAVTIVDNIAQFATGESLVVNCTPLGGPLSPKSNPVPKSLDWRQIGFYFDLNYNADNRTVKAARDAGVRAIDGSSMLVAQALKSMELWTGTSVELEPVYTKVFPDRRSTEICSK
jgi:shikimate dehydrogenase